MVAPIIRTRSRYARFQYPVLVSCVTAQLQRMITCKLYVHDDTRALLIKPHRATWLSFLSSTGTLPNRVRSASIFCSRSLVNSASLTRANPLGATWPWPPQQRPMPDADHAPAFWTSVANTFKSYSNVIFDLHNEPFPDNNQGTTGILLRCVNHYSVDTPTAWSCWRDGCWVSQEGYQAVGMTALLAAVRSTGTHLEFCQAV